jgi:outer membrane biosynthesis protein TonB
MAEQYQQQSWFPGYPPQAMYYAPPNTLTGNLGQSLDPMAMQSMQYRQFQQGQMPIGSQGMPNFQATLAQVPKEEEGLKKKKKGAGKPKKKIAKKPKKKPKKKAAKKKKPKKKKPAVDKQAQQKKKRVLEQKKKLAEQAKNKRKQEAEKKKRAKEKEKVSTRVAPISGFQPVSRYRM